MKNSRWTVRIVRMGFGLILGCALPFAGRDVRGAHHSFAMFDTETTITVEGTVTAFEWTNPHAYIELDVDGDDGEVHHWTIELGSPSILMQSGWMYSDIQPGDRVSATLNPLRDGQPGGLLGRVTLEDGRELGNGPGR
jgi:hypothetical protein